MPTASFAAPRFVHVFAALMLIAGGLYYAFILVDAKFLPARKGIAEVTGKHYRPFEEKHELQNIGGRMQPIKIAVPEAWILTLNMGGDAADYAVARQVFESTREGDRYEIEFKRKRITGGLEIIRIVKQEGG